MLGRRQTFPPSLYLSSSRPLPRMPLNSSAGRQRWWSTFTTTFNKERELKKERQDTKWWCTFTTTLLLLTAARYYI